VSLGSRIKLACQAMGFDIIRLSPQKLVGLDPYHAQKTIFHNRPVKNILDVGANIGQTADKYRTLFPQATIYSFEPFEEAFNQLSKAFSGIQSVKPHKLAVSDSSGSKTLFVNQDNTTNSLLATTNVANTTLINGQMTSVGTVQVQTTTIDDFCPQQNIQQIDILKMDIQGGELMALRGARSMLQRQAISLIYSEVLFAPLYKDQAFFADILLEMRGYGYELFGLYELNAPGGKGLAWGDAIFLSRELNQAFRGTS
jgi:FkbM family methyltransferase